MKDAPTPSPDESRVHLLYYFCRMQLPSVRLDPQACTVHLERSFSIFAKKNDDAAWDEYLDNLYPLDWFVSAACLEGDAQAWEVLFASRAGRSDCLLIDALRARAARQHRGNEERQESAITEFWGNLYAPLDRPNSRPILARYDGLRPLVPWLIRVFQNWLNDELRKKWNEQSLPDDDFVATVDAPPRDHWYDVFGEAARSWLDELSEDDLILLGLRFRFQLSQRDVASILGIHEGNISKKITKLSEHWKDSISRKMIDQGWTGEDLNGYVRTEMRNLLLDDLRLSADHLAHLLAGKGKTLPKSIEE